MPKRAATLLCMHAYPVKNLAAPCLKKQAKLFLL